MNVEDPAHKYKVTSIKRKIQNVLLAGHVQIFIYRSKAQGEN